MNTWHIFTNDPPTCDETVLCLLNNGQQVTLAFDQSKNEWSLYEGGRLEDAIVIAWTELDKKKKIEEQLGIKKIDNKESKSVHMNLNVSQKP